MRAYNLFTEEIDFVDDAVAELKAEFDAKVAPEGLLKHTAAVIYTDSVLDIDAFLEEFRKVFSFPVLGCSGMTMFDRSHGVNRSGICILLMTADDMEFASVSTGVLTPENLAQELRSTYEKGIISLGKAPGLILLFGDTLGVCPSDDIVAEMDRITGKIALFGGCSAGALDSDRSFVFTDQIAGSNRIAMLFLAGEGLKNALFRYEMSVEDTGIFQGTVTEIVNGWRVGKVNDEVFLDRLKKTGIENGDAATDYTFQYISNPFMVTRRMENGDEIAMLRNLVDIDLTDGSASFAGRILKDSHIAMGSISKERVATSSKAAFEHLLQTAKEQGLTPSAFLCVSCKARYFNLSAERLEEVNAYDQVLDPDTALIGMYSQGEICPQPSSTGGFFNIAHNSTIAILAL